MISPKSILNELESYSAFDQQEAESLQKTREFLSTHADPATRETLDGHITASAWILSPDKKEVLLTLHPKFQRWVQLGGHVERIDTSIANAALREATEESGIDGLIFFQKTIFDMDAHPIPARGDVPTHIHYDLRYLFIAPTKEFRISDETLDLHWRSLDELLKGEEHGLRRMAQKTIRLLAEGSE